MPALLILFVLLATSGLAPAVFGAETGKVDLVRRVETSADGRSPVLVLAQAQRPQQASPFEEIPEAERQAPANPFEEIPTAEPQTSPFEDVQEGREQRVGDFIEEVEFRGARRIPRDSLAARIFSKKGDTYDEEALRRDFMVMWNTGYFDDLRLEVEDGEQGKIVRFVVLERRVVRTIRYEGNKSATVSDILERFAERNVGLSVEDRYDPTTVQRATLVLRELLGERGRQYAKIEPQVRQIPPSSVEIVFNIEEGPKVKTGQIGFAGNTVLSDRTLKRSMKALKPIGIPKSLLFESLFSKTFDVRKLEADKELVRNEYQKQGYFRASVPTHDLEIRDKGHPLAVPRPVLVQEDQEARRRDDEHRGRPAVQPGPAQLHRRRAVPHAGERASRRYSR